MLSVPQALALPQVAQRELLKTFDDVPGVDRPITVARTGFQALRRRPRRRRSAAASSGAHTDEVLRAAGYSADEIAALRARPASYEARRRPERRGAPAEARATGGRPAIIDIEPGKIAVRGYPIQELIGTLALSRHDLADAARRDARRRRRPRLLEAALVAAVDHGPHAPSIAIARMAVTCGLPLNGAMASAINALDDVHGGAGQQCMELFAAIAAAAGDAEASADVIAAGSSASRRRTARSSRASAIAGTASIRARCACSQLVREAEQAGVVARPLRAHRRRRSSGS